MTDAIKQRMKKNLVQSRTFSDMVEKAIRQYKNRPTEPAKVISELNTLP